MGTFTLDQLTPLYRKPLETAAAGDIIGPLEAPNGYQVVRLVSREGERKPTFDEVSADIKQNLMESKAREQYLAWMGELRRKIYIKVIRGGDDAG